MIKNFATRKVCIRDGRDSSLPVCCLQSPREPVSPKMLSERRSGGLEELPKSHTMGLKVKQIILRKTLIFSFSYGEKEEINAHMGIEGGYLKATSCFMGTSKMRIISWKVKFVLGMFLPSPKTYHFNSWYLVSRQQSSVASSVRYWLPHKADSSTGESRLALTYGSVYPISQVTGPKPLNYKYKPCHSDPQI